MTSSRSLRDKLPNKSHIIRGTGGVQAEIGYAIEAIESAFLALELEGQLSPYRTDIVDPTVNDDASQGYTRFSRWINVMPPAKEYVLLDPTVGAADWKETTGVGSGGSVSTVFGRSGNVVAANGDYTATQITNNSGVLGATVAAALDFIYAAIPPPAAVLSVFGRTGAVSAVFGDYAASQVNNDSAVSGGSVAAALNTLDTTKVPTTRTVTAGLGLTGGGSLSGNIALAVGPHPDGSIVVGSGTVRVGVLATDAQHGNRGGGSLHADATTIVSGFMSATDKAKLNGIEAGAEVNDVFSVFGRVGAVVALYGDYSSSEIINDSTVAGITVADALDTLGTPYTSPDSSIVISGTTLQVGVLSTDAQHGNRGGGGLHTAATTLVAGFLSAADKTKLDGLNWDVKVSSNDTTPGFLNGKLVAGTGVFLTEINDGGNETFEISAPGAAALDRFVGITTNDTTPSFLDSKLVAGRNVRLVVVNPGANETLRVDIDRLRVRNETGSSIPQFSLVTAVGYSLVEGAILIALADKDTPTAAQAVGALLTTLADSTTGDALYAGGLVGVDTSTFSVGDSLFLGSTGLFSLGPKDLSPFTGSVQAVGTVTRSDAVNGAIQLQLDSTHPESADCIYDLEDSLERGVQSGFTVTRGGGLDIDVAAGVGFVEAGGVLTRVVFAGGTITLPANVTRYLYVDNLGVLQATMLLPVLAQSLVLATAHTDASSVVLLSTYHLDNRNAHQREFLYKLESIGVLTISGGFTTINAPLSLNVDAAAFYIGDNRKTVPATAGITFAVWYQDGLGNWTLVPAQTDVDPETYDDGSGTLAAVAAGEWKKDVLYLAKNNDGTGVEYHLVVAQAVFASQALAEAAPIPSPSSDLAQFALRLAGVVSQQGSGVITSIMDERPFIGQSTSVAGGGGPSAPHETLRQLIHLADGGGPFEGFVTGAYEEYTPSADPFPTSAIWWTDSGKTSKIVEQTVTYNGNKTINTSEWKVYDTDGTTVLATVTDAFAYSGIFELNRTRAIA